jgi:hypothetical protein
MRFSLLTLIALTSVAGLACAALAKPSGDWLTVIVTLTALAYIVQVLRAILLTGAARASALGWLLFATAYLALALGPWSGQHVGPSLLSSRALLAAQTRWLPEARDVDLAFTLTGSSLVAASSPQYTININSNTSYAILDSYLQALSIADVPPRSLSPAGLFHWSGHWLCAWLAGWLGAAIAAAAQRRGSGVGSRGPVN